MRINQKGFTFIETIIVISILSILFSVTILVLNPAHRIAQTYDTQRINDVNAISRAIQQYYIDYRNYDNLGLKEYFQEICATGFLTEQQVLEQQISESENEDCAGCNDLLNLAKITPIYLVGIPNDPLNIRKDGFETLSGSGYFVKNESNTIYVYSNNLEKSSDYYIEGYFGNIKKELLILIIIIMSILLLWIYLVRKTNSEKR
ncbi:MAG TPA: prepilin-type N-terminal cleavage/methylation domain-containing protein [Candidatus Paceibacterota bacterium]|nr:prepilin-type N-terminal cleavage/methylation domain-containing protein [Candidatus Paceibacterota bacterium]